MKHNYNGWRPDLDSQLLAVASTVYERLFGEPPVVTAIHAGLETAVIGSKVSGRLDMLAIGPQIEGPHSPDERVSIPTVGALLAAARRASSTSCPLRGRSRTCGADRSPGSSASQSASCWCSVVTALIGNRDERGETVTAGEWAQSVCGAVGVWRGELEAIVDDIRTPSANASAARSRSRRRRRAGRASSARAWSGACRPTETLVEGIDNAGIPDTPEGEQAAEQVSDWADRRRRRPRGGAGLARRGGGLASRRRSSSSRGRRGRSGPCSRAACRRSPTSLALDPELAAAFGASSTCQQLREETS